jgi:uncharacterized protein (TIGR03437 family)
MRSALFLFLIPLAAVAQSLTPAPNGPYRIVGSQILDRQGEPYLIRGTRLAPLSPDRADEKSSPDAFGPLSATTLITIRQRLNMNAVRLPVSAAEFNSNPEYRLRVERLIGLANQLELLVILETSEAAKKTDLRLFWKNVATRFKDNPNTFFAPLSLSLAAEIRKSGALQPLIVTGPAIVRHESRGLIYERTARLANPATVPILINGLDPQLDQASKECAAFPRDPAEATALVEADLDYFDAQRISWTISSFTAGKLITDYRYFNGTKLDAGWTCGKPAAVPAGLGMVLLSHLWGATPLGLFTVSENRGGLVIARGGISTAYGPILADEAMEGHGPPFPTVLGNISIRITDSRGVARLAPLLHTGAGWTFTSFLVPEECATGPAEVAVVRTDGSVSKGKVLIGDIAPALFTSPPDGRSAVVGEVTQHAAGQPDKSFPISTTSIPLQPGVSTSVRLLGTGFRYAGAHPDIRVTVGSVVAPVLAVGRSTEPGNDYLTVRLPDELTSAGETDLYFTINGQLSNVVRINCGPAR